MTTLEKLNKLDVESSMADNVKIIEKALKEVDLKKEKEAKKVLDIVDKKVTEIEEYFWRPVDSTEVYKMLRDYSTELKDKKKAEKYEGKMKLIDANDLEFKGRVQQFFGNNIVALDYYKKALNLVPDHPLAGPSSEKAEKRIKKAREDLVKLKSQYDKKKGEAKFWYKKGIALLTLDKAQEAIDCFFRSAETDDSDPDAWARIGTALETQGKYEESLQYFEKALEIKPSSMTAKRGKNYANYFLGRLDDVDEKIE